MLVFFLKQIFFNLEAVDGRRWEGNVGEGKRVEEGDGDRREQFASIEGVLVFLSASLVAECFRGLELTF